MTDLTDTSFNNLTLAEAERLAMLAEECAEVVQVIGKILRHGYDAHHPADPRTSNRALLANELMDVDAVVSAMKQSELRGYATRDPSGVRWQKKVRFAHHQGDDE
jgi:hypothetical protein